MKTMSQKRTHIESKIEESLKSLDRVERVNAPDFFYTRLQARMEAEVLGQSNKFFWIGNLRLSMVVMALVLIMNFLSLLMIDFSGNSQSTDDLSTLSSEYFSPTDDYNYLNNQ